MMAGLRVYLAVMSWGKECWWSYDGSCWRRLSGSHPCFWAGCACSADSWLWGTLISFLGLVGQGKVRSISYHVLDQYSANLPSSNHAGALPCEPQQ